MQSQLISDTSYGYKPVQQEGQIKVVVSLWVHMSKMLWKFVKIQKITASTSTTSFQASLICDLATKGFRATGTMRNDGIIKCPLVDIKKMKKNEKGSFDFRSDGNILRRNDNYFVTMGSNAYSM